MEALFSGCGGIYVILTLFDALMEVSVAGTLGRVGNDTLPKLQLSVCCD